MHKRDNGDKKGLVFIKDKTINKLGFVLITLGRKQYVAGFKQNSKLSKLRG